MTNREKFEAHMETCDGCEVSMVELLTSPLQTPAKQAEIDEHMSKRPFLAETPTEAERMAHAGRSWPALKESKSFDTQRLNESPLFDRRLF